MRAYKKITIITGIVAVVSFVCCVLFHYAFKNNSEIDFWINVLLAVFGSALLTAISSLVTYFYEKRQTMEGFVYSTRRILKFLNRYQESWDLEDKIRFFLSYSDEPKDDWDMQMGKMDFFCERFHHHRNAIYTKIYMPILQFNQAVANHVWHFRWHMDGSGKNDAVMEKFVKELEDMLISGSTKKVPSVYDDNGNATQYIQISSAHSKLVKEVQTVLNYEFFDYMYGKKSRVKKGNK